MHQAITEHNILIFLLQVLLLLGLARGLGHVCRLLGQPSLLGEILTGLLLGPTILGRFAPDVQSAIFPAEAVQVSMLDTVAWIGLFLLLLSAGLDVDVSVAWRQKGAALKIALTDIVLPMAVAFVPAMLLPDYYLGDPSKRLVFALFIATVSTISALPMTVKALHDLDLLKTDIGLLSLSALTINDIIGWAVFTIVLGFAVDSSPGLGHVALVIGGTVVFATLCLTVGRHLVSHGINVVQGSRHGDAGLVLTFVCCVAFIGGIITQWLGIHALFGFFLAGIMAGDAPRLSERTRHVISQMVYAIFVPVFFATVGLRIDFIGSFDLLLVVLLTGVGIGGRYLGAWVGARMTKLSADDRVTVAIAHTPGGSMEMVVALVAWQFGLITEPVFVAIIFAAISSSILLGPWMAWSIRRRRKVQVIDFFRQRAFRLDLEGPGRWDVLDQLSAALGELDAALPAEQVADAVRSREEIAGTAVGNEIAFPHARLDGLSQPLIAFGRSRIGVEWNSPDGLPVHLVFLILTPAEAEDLQVQILAALARTLVVPEVRQRLLEAADADEAMAILREAMGQHDGSIPMPAAAPKSPEM